jgi:hypothetical protein
VNEITEIISFIGIKELIGEVDKYFFSDEKYLIEKV